MTKMKISVIIPHYDDLERLNRCLTALLEQTVPGHNFEIIVADNMSPLISGALADTVGERAKIVFASERGAGPTRNAGVEASSGHVLAFTDSDCIPDSRWLEEGVASLREFDLVGGRMKVVCEHDGNRSGAEAYETVFAFDNETYVRKKGFTVTANLFCTREVFDSTGPFRVGMSEDVDWCLRARSKGFRLGYAPGAIVGHPPRPDWPQLQKKWHRLNAELFELALQRKGGRLRWTVHMLAMPMSAIWHLPRAAGHKELRGARQRLGAVATLFRLRLWRCKDGLRRVFGIVT